MSLIHQLEQGTPEWLAFRAEHFGASEASAMLGISPYMSREELLRLKKTGIAPEVPAHLKAIFDRGHETEIGGRKMAESIIGSELFPATYSDGVLSVSCDGLTMLGDVAFEHKLYSAELADSVRAGVLPTHHQPQCQQAMLVTGAERLLFMTSDGTPENCAWMWVHPDEMWRAELMQGWTQFAIDLENYVPTESKPAPVAAPIEALPALFVQVEGKVLATNLDAFKASAQTFIDNIKTELINDQDFADADKMVKFLKDGEERLALAKQQALAQTSSIDELFRAVDAISEQMKAKRLALDKLVKSEKENRKAQIITEARQAIYDHIVKLNDRIGGRWMPPASATPFAEAIKGLKSLDSMRDKVATALAQAKIDANAIADTIEANRKSLLIGTENDTSHLFPDFAQVCTKAREDFAALHAMRMQQEAARKEAERERIRHEEADRITREAAASQAKAQAANDQLGKQSVAESEPEVQGQDQVAERQSATPIENHNEHLLEMVNDTMIDAFMRLLQNSAADKKVIRAALVKWEKYRVALSLKEAA